MISVEAVLTADCRFTGLDHNNCAGHIYLGSIFGKPTDCECPCHATTNPRRPRP